MHWGEKRGVKKRKKSTTRPEVPKKAIPKKWTTTGVPEWDGRPPTLS